MKKTVLIRIFGVVFMLLSLVFISRVARRDFHKNSNIELQNIGDFKKLEFNAGFNSEVALALQLSKSSVIIQHLEDPDDEILRDLAWKEFATFKKSFLGDTIFWLSAENKDFYSDMAFSYNVNPNNPDDYWYNLTIHDTEVYNFNINYNAVMDKTMLWVNVPVRNDRDVVVGMVGTGIPISDFTDTMFSTLDEDIVMYFYNDKLEITGTRDSENVADKILITSSMPEIKGQNLIVEETTFINNVHGAYMLLPFNEVGWTAVIHIPYNFVGFLQNAYKPFIIFLLINLAIWLYAIIMHASLSN